MGPLSIWCAHLPMTQPQSTPQRCLLPVAAFCLSPTSLLTSVPPLHRPLLHPRCLRVLPVASLIMLRCGLLAISTFSDLQLPLSRPASSSHLKNLLSTADKNLRDSSSLSCAMKCILFLSGHTSPHQPFFKVGL